MTVHSPLGGETAAQAVVRRLTPKNEGRLTLSQLTPEETARIKEEQRIRTGETVKTVAKMYFTVVGIIIGILVLVCICGIVYINLNTR